MPAGSPDCATPKPCGIGWHSIVRSTIRRRRNSGSGNARVRVLMYCGSPLMSLPSTSEP
jgi:hypothetical protein